MKLPEKLLGIAIGADGRPIGLDLPSLDVRGAGEAWRARLGGGPFYARFEDRSAEPSLDRVQRLARLGEVWVDCAIDDVDGALDLLIAGASRLVLWGEDPDLLEAVGDSAVVGWDGRVPLPDAFAAAAPHQVPVLATMPDGDAGGQVHPSGGAPSARAAAIDAPVSTPTDAPTADAPTADAPTADAPTADAPTDVATEDRRWPPVDAPDDGSLPAALYQAPPRPWTGKFDVVQVGTIDDDADEEGDDE